MSSSWVVHSRSRGWAAWALSSVPRLLVFFVIVVFFLSVSTYVDYRSIERRTEIGARVFAAPLALMAAFLLFTALQWHRTHWTLSRCWVPAAPDASASSGGSPWVLALVVAVLLVMLSFQSSVHSMWFRPLWGSYYYS